MIIDSASNVSHSSGCGQAPRRCVGTGADAETPGALIRM
jgi:hypothetical protein